MIYLIPAAGVLALVFALFKAQWVKSQDAGDAKMQTIAGHIHEGAMAFLSREYRVLAAQVVVDMLLDEESTSLADLQEFIGKPIRLQVESMYHQELFDVVPI